MPTPAPTEFDRADATADTELDRGASGAATATVEEIEEWGEQIGEVKSLLRLSYGDLDRRIKPS